MTRPAKNLLLALGNDLLGDDGAALAAARTLGKEFGPPFLDVVETSEAGLALMEVLTGYERALLMDSVQTGAHEPGTVIEFKPGDFRKVVAPSPHYAGIPEVFGMAERLGIPLPSELRILAIEVANPFGFADRFTPGVQAGMPALIAAARGVLTAWLGA